MRHISFTVSFFLLAIGLNFTILGCATLPYPRGLCFVETPPADMRYEEIGVVEASATWQKSCDAAYDTAVAHLLEKARKLGGDKVIKVRTVTENKLGQRQELSGKKCFGTFFKDTSVQGVAIK